MAKIIILGAGFGGLDAALMLRKKVKDEIFVIDRSKFHNFIPSLDEVVAKNVKQEKLQINLEKLFLKKTDFMQDEIVRIDTERKVVVTKTNTLHYDALLVALGSEPDFIDNFQENSIAFKTMADATRIAEDFEKLFDRDSAAIMIIGAGSTGAELACTMMERKEKLCKKKGKKPENFKITLVEKRERVLHRLPEQVAQVAEGYIKEMKVEIMLNEEAVSSEKGKIMLKSGKTMESDMIIWCAGIKSSILISESNLPMEKGSLKVNKFLQAEGFEDIFAVGDCMRFIEDGQEISWTAINATQQAEVVAENIAFFLTKKPLTEYRPKKNPILLKLGRNNGIFWNHEKMTRGYYAAKLKKFVEKYHIFTRKHGKMMKLLY
jgi:NADH dehydrogenase